MNKSGGKDNAFILILQIFNFFFIIYNVRASIGIKVEQNLQIGKLLNLIFGKSFQKRKSCCVLRR